MATDKLTLEEFIKHFKIESFIPARIHTDRIYTGKQLNSVQTEEQNSNFIEEIKQDVKRQLDAIDLKKDVFIKDVDDNVFIKEISERAEKAFGQSQANFHFITWVEGEIGINGNKRKCSFWLFPVFAYQNNSMVDLINNSISIVNFRKKLSSIIFNDSKSKVKVTVVGKYAKEFSDISDELSSVNFIRRQTEIIVTHLVELPNVEVFPVGHQYEKYLHATDILILPNGHIGNAIYRAWFSTGLATHQLNHANIIIHKGTHLPLWIGKSIYDPQNPFEEDFASACQGLKDYLRKSSQK